MQVLKEEIRESILSAAQTLFLQRGFQKTTMKEVADKVGISKGNLYHYYKSKEDIYKILTGAAYRKLTQFADEFMQKDFDIDHGEFSAALTERALRLYDEKQGLLLIFDAAEGTEYENSMREITAKVAEKLARKFFEGRASGLVATIISRNLVAGLAEVLRCSASAEELEENIARLVSYHENGMKAFL